MPDPAFPTIREITAALEAWAPPGSAQSYDNVGLQVGDAGQRVRHALVALDLTPAVLEEARSTGATLIITHHPLLFHPLRRLTPDDLAGGLALRLAEAGIALYSLHTNLDAAPGGVSFALAERLGLTDVRFLDPLPETLCKLVTFVPSSHFDAVRAALAEAGAGRIGDYDACAFALEGTGFFRPGAEADPFIGRAGALESVREMRLEVEVARWDLERVIRAMKTAHPYEEVAYDVYPVQQPATRAGLGALGRLPEPEPLTAFLRRVAERLEAGSLRYAGNPAARIETVAVCGGAGSHLTRTALRAGADAFVTADVSYHRFFDVLDPDGHPRMALIDAGHYETEAVTETLLCEWLGRRFPGVTWQRTRTRTSPMHTFTP
ncbi:MAG: Nif3-like dinuclear metal center hexameric protein [Rhodothermaceae bacterium]|nr:MAG: Nif3-like dinuclear metal center hexameric protein [Rhodothermaceae bacterium]